MSSSSLDEPSFSGVRGPLRIDGVCASRRLSLQLALAFALFLVHKLGFTLIFNCTHGLNIFVPYDLMPRTAVNDTDANDTDVQAKPPHFALEMHSNISLSECKDICSGFPDCFAFKYGVEYGVDNGAVDYQAGDCQPLVAEDPNPRLRDAESNADLYAREQAEVDFVSERSAPQSAPQSATIYTICTLAISTTTNLN